MSEHEPLSHQEQNKSSLAHLTERRAAMSEEEKNESLLAGIELMVEEHRQNPDMFEDKMTETARANKEHADRVSADLARIRLEIGDIFDIPGQLESRRGRMAPTDEERLADKMAAQDAYYAKLPPLQPGGRR